MRYRLSSAMWGLFWIALGFVILGNVFQWWDISLFFPGWWTLFIIVPCGISIVSHGFGSFSTFGLLVGILLLLNCQGIILAETFRKLLVPMVLVLIGFSIITRNLFSGNSNVHVSYGKDACYAATFSANHIIYPHNKFCGAEIDSVFGGVTLDLRNAIIDENVRINCTSVFGGIDIYVPNGIKVKTNSTSFFGGVSKKVRNELASGCPVIYVNATCMFGGVDIK